MKCVSLEGQSRERWGWERDGFRLFILWWLIIVVVVGEGSGLLTPQSEVITQSRGNLSLSTEYCTLTAWTRGSFRISICDPFPSCSITFSYVDFNPVWTRPWPCRWWGKADQCFTLFEAFHASGGIMPQAKNTFAANSRDHRLYFHWILIR